MYDLDSRIPNLALMKLSARYRSLNCETVLVKVRSQSKLPPEVEAVFPDYSLYRHTLYAVGFLT